MLRGAVAPSRPGAWLVILGTLVVQATAALATFSLPAVAPEAARDLGLAPAFIGYQIGILYSGAVLSSVFCGFLVRRWGACRTSQAGMVLCGAGCAVMALGGVGAGVVGSVLLGLGYGTTNPASAHLLARFIGGRHRNLIFSVKQTGVPIGGMAAGLMAPSVTIAFGWEWALLTVTGVTVAVMALLQPLRREWDSDADPGLRLTESPLAGLMLVWRYPAVRWLSGSGFCFSLIQLCLLTFLVTLLVVEAEFSLVRAGILLAATNVAGFFGRLAWGWVADRMGRGLAVLVAIGILSLLAAAATSTLAPTWPLSAIQAVFLFYGFTAIGWNGVYLAELVRLSPAGHVGAVTGGAMAVTFAGIIAGPMAFSVAYGAIGSYSGTFVLLVAVAAAGAGLAALAGVASRRPPTR